MYSNLYKAGRVHMDGDACIIDVNEAVERRLMEEVKHRSQLREKETEPVQDGFSEGLNAERVDVLFESDEEAASERAASIKQQEELAKELEATRNELEDVRRQIQQEQEESAKLIEQMKTKALEEANEQGYQEGYQKGLTTVQELQKQCEKERLLQEQEYQQRLQDMEPKLVDILCDVYGHIFGVEVKEHRELVLKLLQDTLMEVDGTGSMMIHVSKEDFSYVQDRKEALLKEAGIQGNSVEIVSDAVLGRAQCMIETESGVYDCSLDTELAELKRRLMLLSYQHSS